MDQLKPRPANSPPLTPLTFLERAATVYGDRPSLIHNDAVVSTWRDTHLRCLRFASSLRGLLGIRHCDVVSTFLPNLPAMLELHFAVPMSGAVLNNLNTRLDPRTISVLLRHSSATAIVVDALSLPTILSAISLLPQSHPPPALIIVEDKPGPKPDHKPDSRYTFYDYEDLVSRGDPGFEWVRPGSEWDPIVLNYTSGTTSDPKGVVHTHRGAFVIAMDSIIGWPLPETPVYLWTLPMFHVNGWSFAWAVAAVGAACVCMRKFDAGDIYAAIRRHGVTHMCGAPVVLNMLSNAAEARRLDRPVQVLTAGAPPPAAVLLRTEKLGFVVSHGYGLTETGGLVVTCAWKAKWNTFPATERARLKARQGVRSVGLTAMDVIDPNTGNPVKRDGQSAGEIVLRGASIMLGYLKDPVGTTKCMSDDGWFKTGDVGVLHPDGYLEIKDRSKDVIISGGENISSVEVESVLYTNPAVNEVAVVARPDEHWGETPCAFVSLRAGLDKKPTEAEIIEFCRAKMARYMVPKTVVFMEELPKTSTGKVQKFVSARTAGKFALLVAFLVALTAVRGHNITRILEDHPSLSTFNHYLTVTHLAADINRRQTITVCAVDNAAMNALLAKHPSVYTIKNVLSLHILLDYFGAKKLHQITNGTALAATMYQATGDAPGSSGFVNITDLKGGKVAFGAEDNGGNLNAAFVKSVKEIPYNLSVIEISQALTSPEAEAPTPGPAELNLTNIMSAHGCKVFADTLKGTDAEQTYLSNLDGGLTVFCPGDDAFKKFHPKYKNLSADGKTSLLLFQAVPIYQSKAMLKSNNGPMNTLATDGANKFDFTVQNDGEDITIKTKLVTAKITGTVKDEQPVAIYTIDKVLLPVELFKGDLAPAPAPAPAKSKKKKKKGHATSPAPSDDDSDSPAMSPDGDVADSTDDNGAGSISGGLLVSVAIAVWTGFSLL